MSTFQISPSITGSKFPPKLPAMFEEVWHISRMNDKTTLRYKPSKKYLANTLFMQGSGVMEDPTYESIMKAGE